MCKHHGTMNTNRGIRLISRLGNGSSGPTLSELKGPIGTFEISSEERARVLSSALDWNQDEDSHRRSFHDRLLDEFIVRGLSHPLSSTSPRKLVEMGTVHIPVWSWAT